MLKKFLVVGVLFLTLVCSCTASNVESTNPTNISKAANVTELTNVTKAANVTEATNVTNAANVTELTNVTKAANVTEATNVTNAANITESTNVTKAANVIEATNVTNAANITESTNVTKTLILTAIKTNDSVMVSNESSKVMEFVPELASGLVDSVKSGIATNYWLELIPFPSSTSPSLSLFVDGEWRKLENPSEAEQSLVKSTFCDCPTSHYVKVWYQSDRIIGLVVGS
jgi:hypothetical protein